MSHQTVTPDPENSMPRHTHLMRRNSRYYLNVKVPKDLREVMGKELIRKSLGTSDPREAARRVRFESSKLDALFDAERKKLEAEAARKAPAAKRAEMSDREVHQLVCRFFVDLEKESEKWWQDQGCKLRDDDLENAIDTFETDLAVARGRCREFAPQDGDMSPSVSAFLEEEGINVPEDSSTFKKLAVLFRQAQVEHLRRLIGRLNGGKTAAHDAMFRDVFAHTPVSRIKSVSLGELVDRHYKALADVKRTEGTQKTYKIPHRLLCEVLGKETLLEDIQKDDVERLLSLLQRAPTRATQRYPGLTLEQAIAVADKKKDSDRLQAIRPMTRINSTPGWRNSE